jgi:glucokinase
VPAREGWIPIQGEGGHTAFSPVTLRETEVLKEMWKTYDHVSTERLASGPGLVALRDCLSAIDGLAASTLAPEDIARCGREGTDAICREALEMFCGILGSAAANLCVTLGARNGVYIGGGIVPSLGDWFDRSPFRARFEHKGRFRSYLAAVPTYVITARNPALRGVARAFTPL